MLKHKINIMLIDDDEASHLIHTVAIEEAGLNLDHVSSCYNVDQAITELKTLIASGSKNSWPDYIFLDINMPRKNGYDFISEFEKLDHKYNTPTIYLVSSSINPKDQQRAKNLELVHGFKSKFLDKEFLETLTTN